MIRLIASDMDGTLLDENAQVPSETFELIEALAEKGVRFATSSGRRLDTLVEFFEPVKDKIDFVASNGAQVLADGHMIDREVFSHGAILRLFEVCESFDCLHLAIFDRTNTFLLDDDKYFVRNGDKDLPNAQRAYDPPAAETSIIKASVFCSKTEHLLDLTSALIYELGDRLSFAPSGSNWIDVTPNGVSKASGLKHLLRYRGIDEQDVMAFGDAMNDYEILRFVGHPRVMGNGLYGVKQIVRNTIGTNVEHAVQKEMRKLLEELEG